MAPPVVVVFTTKACVTIGRAEGRTTATLPFALVRMSHGIIPGCGSRGRSIDAEVPGGGCDRVAAWAADVPFPLVRIVNRSCSIPKTTDDLRSDSN